MALMPYKDPALTLFGRANPVSQGQTNNSGSSGLVTGSKREASVSGIVQSGLFEPKKSSFGPSSADTGIPNNQFGSTGTGLFGGGQTTTPSLSKQGSLFGGAQQTTSQTSLFGGSSQQQQTSLTGQSQTQSASLFGAQTNQQSNPSGSTSLFNGLSGSQQPQDQQKQNSLFGGVQTTQQSLFNGAAGTTAQNKTTSLFGGNLQPQPQIAGNTSLFGGPTNTQPQSLLAGQQHQLNQQGHNQNTQAAYQMANLNTQTVHQANPLENFYNLNKTWTPQMLQQMSASMLSDQIIQAGSLTISRLNPFGQRQLKDVSNFEHFVKQAHKIEDKLGKDQESLVQIKSKLLKTQSQQIILGDRIETAKNFVSNLSKGQQCIEFQIQGLQIEVNKLNRFREQLGIQINAYQNYQTTTAQLPSYFFFELQQHHEKLLEQYEYKIREAEILAKVVCDQAVKTQQQMINGGHNHSAPNSHFINTQSNHQLRTQIYDVCKFIYEQQKQTSYQLQQIERKANQLKQDFVLLMMNKKSYVGSFEEIDMLFQLGTVTQPPSVQSNTLQEEQGVHNDVLQKLKEIKNRNITSKLVSQLQKMDLLTKHEAKDKFDGTDSKQLGKALTSLFGKDTMAKNTIKENLKKGLYNQQGVKQAAVQMRQSEQIQMTQGIQGTPIGSLAQHSLLGKRSELTNISPSADRNYSYFKRTQVENTQQNSYLDWHPQLNGQQSHYESQKQSQNITNKCFLQNEINYAGNQNNFGAIVQSVRYRQNDRNRLY